MRSCEELTQAVLCRRDAYRAKQARQRKAAVRIAAGGVCAVAVLALGVWKSGWLRPETAVPDIAGEASSPSDSTAEGTENKNNADNSTPAGETGDPSEIQYKQWPVKVLPSSGTTSSECVLVPEWDQMTIDQQFPGVTFRGLEYSSRYHALEDSSDVGASLGTATAEGYDVYTDTRYTVAVTIHAINGIAEKAAVALHFDGQEGWFVYASSQYKPATLGQFIDDLNLHQTMSVGKVYCEQTDSEGIDHHLEFSGLDVAAVWDMLLTDRTQVRVDSEEYSPVVLDIAINAPLLGADNLSMALTTDGYLRTNLLDTEKRFFIGTEAVRQFRDYVYAHGEGCEIVYETSSGAEDGVPE